MKKVLGYTVMALPLIAFFAAIAVIDGAIPALIIFGSVSLVCGAVLACVIAGVNILED